MELDSVNYRVILAMVSQSKICDEIKFIQLNHLDLQIRENCCEPIDVDAIGR